MRLLCPRFAQPGRVRRAKRLAPSSYVEMRRYSRLQHYTLSGPPKRIVFRYHRGLRVDERPGEWLLPQEILRTRARLNVGAQSRSIFTASNFLKRQTLSATLTSAALFLYDPAGNLLRMRGRALRTYCDGLIFSQLDARSQTKNMLSCRLCLVQDFYTACPPWSLWPNARSDHAWAVTPV